MLRDVLENYFSFLFKELFELFMFLKVMKMHEIISFMHKIIMTV